jgi:hypothetical protein
MLVPRAVSVAINAVFVRYILAVTYEDGVEASLIVRYAVILQILVWKSFG